MYLNSCTDFSNRHRKHQHMEKEETVVNVYTNNGIPSADSHSNVNEDATGATANNTTPNASQNMVELYAQPNKTAILVDNDLYAVSEYENNNRVTDQSPVDEHNISDIYSVPVNGANGTVLVETELESEVGVNNSAVQNAAFETEIVENDLYST